MNHYLVINISAGDKANADLLLEGVMLRSTYSLVSYSSSYTFDGTETSVQPIDDVQFVNLTLSPVFYDYSSGGINKLFEGITSFSKTDQDFITSLKQKVTSYMIALLVPDDVQIALLSGALSTGGFNEFLSFNNPSLLEALLPPATGTSPLSIESLAISIDPSATDATYGWTDLRDYLSLEIENYLLIYPR